MFQTKVVEKTKTHIVCSITLFDNRAFCEVMWKNIIEPGRPQITILRMPIACWIPESTNTHSEYVILICFLLPQWMQERASMLHYTYIVCHVIYANYQRQRHN